MMHVLISGSRMLFTDFQIIGRTREAVRVTMIAGERCPKHKQLEESIKIATCNLVATDKQNGPNTLDH